VCVYMRVLTKALLSVPFYFGEPCLMCVCVCVLSRDRNPTLCYTSSGQFTNAANSVMFWCFVVLTVKEDDCNRNEVRRTSNWREELI